ncbi:Rhodanese-like domain-containing protein [Fusarium oxysporum II5]|nr:Rhodanese-like domain-containing protein [Fusarium oxysporum II5]TXC04008.1 hypothetical protein FocTR4_00000196 [Fusarium oxysporum f. sp. cubense]
MNLTTYLGFLTIRPRSHFAFQKVKRVCSSKMASTDAATPWHAAYPPPLNKTPAAMTRQAVLEMMKDSKNIAGKDYVLIDLRRADREGGTIRGSINLPAQSLYPMIETLYTMFKSAGVQKIIWYCSSSRGRGTRAAGWFQDRIDKQGDSHMESAILFEGITGWAKAGGEFVEWMDEYDSTVWNSK